MLTKKQLNSQLCNYFRLLVSPDIYSNALRPKRDKMEHKDKYKPAN